MTILDFLKTDIIIESENDVYIDASTCDKDELNDWIKNYLYPQFDEDEVRFINNFPFSSLSGIKSNFSADRKYMAKKIVKSALDYRHIPAVEKEYFINDSGSFHIAVKL